MDELSDGRGCMVDGRRLLGVIMVFEKLNGTWKIFGARRGRYMVGVFIAWMSSWSGKVRQAGE